MATQTSIDKQRPQSRTPRTPATSSGAAAVPDEIYGIVSVLYHSLQGAQTYRQYLADAERAGAEEAAEFFRDCLKEENARSRRAKSLLLEELEEEEDSADDEDEDEDEET